ncbi:hypothetical protein EYF80_008316 [Liparis tanakae]|uniref:Uncharacterized protein n=1 Tax=Liparis tanakae TaxID=230148 RepID=A0A4Z2IVH6_9TELE|nr:hypothetical protein EYF80_008316 [Liparis tanakae]
MMSGHQAPSPSPLSKSSLKSRKKEDERSGIMWDNSKKNLSRSSLSSVFDSYSDPIPDSLNRSSSRAPKICSPSGELSSGAPSLGVSPVSWPCSWMSSPREEKRKHSSRTPVLSPRGLVSVAQVPGEQGSRRAETQGLSLVWIWG